MRRELDLLMYDGGVEITDEEGVKWDSQGDDVGECVNDILAKMYEAEKREPLKVKVDVVRNGRLWASHKQMSNHEVPPHWSDLPKAVFESVYDEILYAEENKEFAQKRIIDGDDTYWVNVSLLS